MAENGHNLSECSKSSDSGSGDGGTINKSNPRDRDGFTLVTKRKRNYRNHEFKNPTKSVYKQQPNGSSVPQSSKEYNGANRVLGLRGDSTIVNDKATVTEKMNDKTTAKPVSVEMPDLIDTSEMDLLADGGVSKEKDTDTTTTSATVDNNLEEVHAGVLDVAEYPCFEAYF